MAHWHLNEVERKLIRLRDVRRSALPLRNDGDAVRLLISAQAAFHALAMVRDEEDELREDQILQS